MRVLELLLLLKQLVVLLDPHQDYFMRLEVKYFFSVILSGLISQEVYEFTSISSQKEVFLSHF